jgi:glycogen operon protein
MHVGGFTRSANSGVEHPGTFGAVVEKIPYLKALGVTAVEFLPIFEFDDSERRIVDGREVCNYWGYGTMSFFAPHPMYCRDPLSGDHVGEFRNMVKALHRAGIEVILDVVFNHTDEGNHEGPTFSFKGIDNQNYYYLSPNDPQYYHDYSGCGNTFNCNHPMGTKFILECLRYWVREMHVDGFRFDEASVLSRDEQGVPLSRPPVLWQIETDEQLADCKLFAEAWDAAGLYQVGHFPGYRWGEWNGQYRDDIRRFVKGDPGLIGAVAARIAGSADIYQWSGHLPINSVNFVTAHDGFTLHDLVSYNNKHNWANGEENRDGVNDTLSWNCGAEGDSDDAAIATLRVRQVKNFATILMLSQGIPMMVMGDEIRRTQKGNNNAYCQNNEISWFDWDAAEKQAEMLRFWQQIIDFRKRHRIVHRSRYLGGEVNERGLSEVSWHGCRLDEPGWSESQARALSFTLGGADDEADIHIMLNMYWEELEFAIPPLADRAWHRVVDTARPSPADIVIPCEEPRITDDGYRTGPRSVVLLISK